MALGFTVSDCTTGVAAPHGLSPAWVAVILVVPTPTIVMVLPLTVATAVLELLNMIGLAELGLVTPEIVIGESP